MTRNFTSLVALCILALPIKSQVSNTGFVDTAGGEHIGKTTIGGFIDVYGNMPGVSREIPYMVSSARLGEMAVNLAMLDIRYNNENIRARLVPAFGTFINKNMAAEPVGLKNLVEASAGVRLSKKRNIWLDAGILGSPYTNENPVSKDQMLYTRSLSAENSPYYLCGAKLGMPLGKKLNAYIYLINGWQQMADQNDQPAVGTQLEWTPNKNNIINWNTFIGYEETTLQPQFGTRYFSDLYWIGKLSKRWNASACVYGGIQEVFKIPVFDSTGILPMPEESNKLFHYWWNANVQLKYSFENNLSISGRVEWFNDPHAVMQKSLNVKDGSYRTGSYSLCLNQAINKNAMLRLEYRRFFTGNDNVSIYPFYSGLRDNMDVISTSLSVWF
jgi:hypothetical protein